jgi:Zn-dependent protease
MSAKDTIGQPHPSELSPVPERAVTVSAYDGRTMFGGGSTITLFRVRGITVAVDWSWFLILFLVIFWLSDFYGNLLDQPSSATEPYLLAVASAIGFFGSILLHEFGHAVVAIRNGIGISTIRLWIFGGMAQMDREADGPGTEFKVAIGGPVVTALISAVLVAIGIAVSGTGAFSDAVRLQAGADTSGVMAMVAWLAAINLIVLVFNLLPAFPMDGGRVVRAIAWRFTGKRSSATRFAAGLGQIFAYLFIALGMFLMIQGAVFSGIWLALIGFLINGSARAATAETTVASVLEGMKVGDVMDESPVSIPAHTSIHQALDEYFLRYQWSWFPVTDESGRFAGVIIRDEAESVEETARTAATVGEHLEASSGGFHIREDAPLDSLLGNQDMRKFGALMVTDQAGRLAGVVTLEQLGRALKPG